MRKLNIALLFVIIASMAVSAILIYPVVTATEYNVTVKWVIPSDYSLTISYPTGKGEIDFSPAGQNFSGQGADSQTYTANAVYAMNMTNSGNVAVYIRGNFTSNGMASGVTKFNLTTTSACHKQYWWVVANQSTQQIIYTALASAAHTGFFAFSSGTTVTAGTTTKTFKINSAAS